MMLGVRVSASGIGNMCTYDGTANTESYMQDLKQCMLASR